MRDIFPPFLMSQNYRQLPCDANKNQHGFEIFIFTIHKPLKIKTMAFSQDYLDFVLGQLSEFGEVTYKKMFGGAGLYREGAMFGGIMNGIFHLKVDASTRQEFIDRGMEPFSHGPSKKKLPSYYQVPVEILEDVAELTTWAEKAWQVALAGKK